MGYAIVIGVPATWGAYVLAEVGDWQIMAMRLILAVLTAAIIFPLNGAGRELGLVLVAQARRLHLLSSVKYVLAFGSVFIDLLISELSRHGRLLPRAELHPASALVSALHHGLAIASGILF